MKFGLLGLLLAIPGLAQTDMEKLFQQSATVLNESMNAGDHSIPQGLLEKAHCVGIVPNSKHAGFIFGGKYGKGVLTCRKAGQWSAPSVIRIEGGSFGLQIGAGETDIVFLVMNQDGVDNLMKDKFTLGANAGVMAGPVGRSAQAETDAAMHAEILGYSRSRGAFAGVALNGATLRPDNGDNKSLYGHDVKEAEILQGSLTRPAAAQPLYTALDKYSMKTGG